jgi:hypothetical protein
MAPKDITAIAIRFFGIYLLVNVILYFPVMITAVATLQQQHSEKFSSSIYIYIVGSFILLGVVVSLLLFRLANSIASRVPVSSEPSAHLTQGFLLQVLGIYFIVSALSALPGYGFSLLKSSSIELTQLLYLFGYVFEAAVGCYLVVKPVVWNRWLNQLRGRA